ncbi:hypothetical protein NLJ89_g11435 [Agrocybe chaxingu]|uniref:Uncharacterized protein n=1 Tax=Agrocybe chaxingu TaxID=84603 RepID=A0A9W8JQ07_9AGAR|nr:hypothetical protein NLJ89_g11435 [Agrocybe chaxingu]
MSVSEQPGVGLDMIYAYMWGQDRVQVHSDVAGKRWSTIDLTPVRLELNARPDDFLLVRDEYVLAYNTILADTLSQTAGHRSAFLVTGQPGIGKTLFLLYVLARRLQDRHPVALQINSHQYALFDEHGDWVKRLCAIKYIMDVWSQEELQTLLTISNLDVERGMALYDKFGPSPRVVVDILQRRTTEEGYSHEIETGASTLARQFLAMFSNAENLDFSSDPLSKIFTVRPKSSNREIPVLFIPTPVVASALGMAFFTQERAQQHAFFNMLKVHPSLRSAAGWFFESYAHVCFSDPNRDALQAYRRDGGQLSIPRIDQRIAGPSALSDIQPPHNFLLATPRSQLPRSATDGLKKVHKDMNHISGLTWHLVIVGPERGDAEYARDRQKLTDGWETTEVYACELQLGQLTEQLQEKLQIVFNNSSETYQRANSGFSEASVAPETFVSCSFA